MCLTVTKNLYTLCWICLMLILFISTLSGVPYLIYSFCSIFSPLSHISLAVSFWLKIQKFIISQFIVSPSFWVSPPLGLFSPKKNVLFPSKIYYLPLRFILPLFDTYVKGFLWGNWILGQKGFIYLHNYFDRNIPIV